MAKQFNLTARINMIGPFNMRPIVSKIKRELAGIKPEIKFKLSGASQASIKKITAEFKKLDLAVNKVNASVGTLNTQFVSLAAATSRIASSMNGATKSVNSTTTAINKVSKSTKIARTAMEEFGHQAGLAIKRFAAFAGVTSVVFAFTNALSSAFKEFITFNDQIVKLSQITGKSVGEMQGLSDEVTRLSVGLGVSSSKLIAVSNTLAQAGLSATDTRIALEALAKTELSPTFDDITQTTEGAIAIMRQFGISAGDLEKALGSVNSVSAAFAVESSDIITAVQRAGGVFASTSRGVSSGTDALNEFVAVFTSVRQTTRESAESIATGLRTIFTRIQRADTIDLLKNYGVELRDLEGKFVGPYEAARRLSEGLSTIDPRSAGFAKISEELGGFRQIGKVLPLLQQFSVAQEALNVAQKGSGSLIADAIKAQQSLAVQFTKTRENFLSLIRELGESTTFKVITTAALFLTNALIDLSRVLKPLLPVLASVAAFKIGSGLKEIFTSPRGFFSAFGGSGPGGAAGGPAGPGGPGGTGGGSGGSQQLLTNVLRINVTATQGLINSIGALNNSVLLLQQQIVNTNALLLNRPLGRADGGPILGFNKGGIVPGTGNTDKVLAKLTPKEAVLNQEATRKLGGGVINHLNNGGSIEKFAKAGRVGRPSLEDMARSGLVAPVPSPSLSNDDLMKLHTASGPFRSDDTKHKGVWSKILSNIISQYPGFGLVSSGSELFDLTYNNGSGSLPLSKAFYGRAKFPRPHRDVPGLMDTMEQIKTSAMQQFILLKKQMFEEANATPEQIEAAMANGLFFAAVGMRGVPYSNKMIDVDDGTGKLVKAIVSGYLMDQVLAGEWEKAFNSSSDVAISKALAATGTVVDPAMLKGASADVQGHLFQAALHGKGAPTASRDKKSLDFPSGLGAATYLFGDQLDPSTPTDAKRTLRGPEDVASNIQNFLKSKTKGAAKDEQKKKMAAQLRRVGRSEADIAKIVGAGYASGGIVQKFKAGGLMELDIEISNLLQEMREGNFDPEIADRLVKLQSQYDKVFAKSIKGTVGKRKTRSAAKFKRDFAHTVSEAEIEKEMGLLYKQYGNLSNEAIQDMLYQDTIRGGRPVIYSQDPTPDSVGITEKEFIPYRKGQEGSVHPLIIDSLERDPVTGQLGFFRDKRGDRYKKPKQRRGRDTLAKTRKQMLKLAAKNMVGIKKGIQEGYISSSELDMEDIGNIVRSPTSLLGTVPRLPAESDPTAAFDAFVSHIKEFRDGTTNLSIPAELQSFFAKTVPAYIQYLENDGADQPLRQARNAQNQLKAIEEGKEITSGARKAVATVLSKIIKLKKEGVTGFSTGGRPMRFAAGGGPIPALVSNGEIHVPAKEVKHWGGYKNLDILNRIDQNKKYDAINKVNNKKGASIFKGPGGPESDLINTSLDVGDYILRAKASKEIQQNGMKKYHKGGFVGGLFGFARGGSADIQKFKKGRKPRKQKTYDASALDAEISAALDAFDRSGDPDPNAAPTTSTSSNSTQIDRGQLAFILSSALTTQLLPAIQKVSESMKDMNSSITPVLSGLTELSGSVLNSAIGLNAFNLSRGAKFGVGAAAAGFAATGGFLKTSTTKTLEKALLQNTKAINKFDKSLKDYSEATTSTDRIEAAKEVEASFFALDSQIKNSMQTIKDLENTKKLGGLFGDIGDTIVSTAAGFGALQLAIGPMTAGLTGIAASAAALAPWLVVLVGAVSGGIAVWNYLKDTSTELTDQTSRLNQAFRETIKTTNQFSLANKTFAEQILPEYFRLINEGRDKEGVKLGIRGSEGLNLSRAFATRKELIQAGFTYGFADTPATARERYQGDQTRLTEFDAIVKRVRDSYAIPAFEDALRQQGITDPKEIEKRKRETTLEQQQEIGAQYLAEFDRAQVQILAMTEASLRVQINFATLSNTTKQLITVMTTGANQIINSFEDLESGSNLILGKPDLNITKVFERAIKELENPAGLQPTDIDRIIKLTSPFLPKEFDQKQLADFVKINSFLEEQANLIFTAVSQQRFSEDEELAKFLDIYIGDKISTLTGEDKEQLTPVIREIAAAFIDAQNKGTPITSVKDLIGKKPEFESIIKNAEVATDTLSKALSTILTPAQSYEKALQDRIEQELELTNILSDRIRTEGENRLELKRLLGGPVSLAEANRPFLEEIVARLETGGIKNFDTRSGNILPSQVNDITAALEKAKTRLLEIGEGKSINDLLGSKDLIGESAQLVTRIKALDQVLKLIGSSGILVKNAFEEIAKDRDLLKSQEDLLIDLIEGAGDPIKAIEIEQIVQAVKAVNAGTATQEQAILAYRKGTPFLENFTKEGAEQFRLRAFGQATGRTITRTPEQAAAKAEVTSELWLKRLLLGAEGLLAISTEAAAAKATETTLRNSISELDKAPSIFAKIMEYINNGYSRFMKTSEDITGAVKEAKKLDDIQQAKALDTISPEFRALAKRQVYGSAAYEAAVRTADEFYYSRGGVPGEDLQFRLQQGVEADIAARLSTRILGQSLSAQQQAAAIQEAKQSIANLNPVEAVLNEVTGGSGLKLYTQGGREAAVKKYRPDLLSAGITEEDIKKYLAAQTGILFDEDVLSKTVADTGRRDIRNLKLGSGEEVTTQSLQAQTVYDLLRAFDRMLITLQRENPNVKLTPTEQSTVTPDAPSRSQLLNRQTPAMAPNNDGASYNLQKTFNSFTNTLQTTIQGISTALTGDNSNITKLSTAVASLGTVTQQFADAVAQLKTLTRDGEIQVAINKQVNGNVNVVFDNGIPIDVDPSLNRKLLEQSTQIADLQRKLEVVVQRTA